MAKPDESFSIERKILDLPQIKLTINNENSKFLCFEVLAV